MRKTASANTDEGSLGATVDLVTGKPLDYKGRKLALSAEDAYYENGGTHNPRVALLVADQWFDGRLGVSLSGAYSERDSEVDRYKRQQGSRTTSIVIPRSLAATTPFRARILRARGHACWHRASSTPPTIAALTGSDPAAYAALFPGAPYQHPGALRRLAWSAFRRC